MATLFVSMPPPLQAFLGSRRIPYLRIDGEGAGGLEPGGNSMVSASHPILPHCTAPIETLVDFVSTSQPKGPPVLVGAVLLRARPCLAGASRQLPGIPWQ